MINSPLYNIHLVCDYLNMSYIDVMNKLSFDEFDAFLREAYINKCLQSEQGYKQLQDYKRLNTTEPNMDNINKFMKGV